MRSSRFAPPRHALPASVLALGLVACTGTIQGPLGAEAGDDGVVGGAGHGGSGGKTGGTGGTMALPAAAPARVRRLNQVELRNTIADVFGVRDLGAVTFPVETQQGKFDNGFESLTFTQDFADSLVDVSEAVGAAVAKNLATLAPCDLAKKGETGCSELFVDTMGPRAYRRPFLGGERDRLLGVYKAVRAGGDDHATGISALVEAMIQSPNFAHRTELGTQSGTRVALAPYETASALSYFLTRSAPDPALLDAAANGTLQTKAGLVEQAKRLLAKPSATTALHDFFLQWLELTTASQITKGDKAFTPAVARSMVDETVRFIDAAWAKPDGWSNLLTSPDSFVNAALAPIYGVTTASTDLSPMKLDPARRGGFLTHASFIAAHSPGQDRSPIMLGHFVRAKMLCDTPPAPPPGVPPAPTDATLDVVSRYRIHEEDPTCGSCHKKMDAIGFGFSQYDVVGRFAPMDHGVPMDGAGSLEDTDVDGAFRGPVELAGKLSQSPQVRACFAGTVLTFALGREARPENALDIDQRAIADAASSAFATGDMKALFLALVSSDAFLLRDTSKLPTEAWKP